MQSSLGFVNVQASNEETNILLRVSLLNHVINWNVYIYFGYHQAQISSKLDRNEKLLNGFLVLSLYLVFDSFTSNWEEKFVRVYLFLLARQLQN